MITDSQRNRLPKVTTMSAYTEVWSVVEGAQDETYTVRPEDADAKALDLARTLHGSFAMQDKVSWEVYVLDHHHADDGQECACAQYLQDHHPIYSSAIY